jgi:ABC-type transport system involved in multi-copper enzyme maturation permease subunit
MSTTTATPAPARPSEPVARTRVRRARFVHALRSEWVKLYSLRSTWWTLGSAAVAVIGLSVVIAYVVGTTKPDAEAAIVVEPSTVLAGSLLFGQLLVGTLGVLFVASEYSTGMIRSTIAAVPRRARVVLAKLLVLSAVTFAAMLATCLAAFLIGNAILDHYTTGFSLSDDTSVRVVLASATYLTLVAVLGSALGWVLRSTATALASLFGVLLVAPGIVVSLGRFGKEIAPYLPSNAGTSFASSSTTPDMLSTWAGFAVLMAWVVAALVAGLIRLRRRDV